MIKPSISLKYLLILATICLLVTQCGKKTTEESTPEPPAVPMWIFNSNSDIDQIRDGLTKDRIFDAERTVSTDGKNFVVFSSGKYVVDFLGIDWKNYSVGILNDTIAYVAFFRLDGSGKDFYESTVTSLVRKLDEIYGSHRQKNVEVGGIVDDNSRSWDWVDGDVSVELHVTSAIKKNDVIALLISKGDMRDLEDLMNHLPL